MRRAEGVVYLRPTGGTELGRYPLSRGVSAGSLSVTAATAPLISHTLIPHLYGPAGVPGHAPPHK